MAKEEKKRSDIDEKYKWDLTSMYKDEKSCQANFELVKKLVDKVLSYKGNITKNTKTFESFFDAYDELERLTDKIYVYSVMLRDQESTNEKHQAMFDKATELNDYVENKLSFIEPEILKTNYDDIKQMISESSKLKEHDFELKCLFRNKKHVLSEKEENVISMATNAFGTGKEVFYNFDNTDVNLGKVKNEKGELVELTHANFINFLTSSDARVRKDGFDTMFSYYESFKNTVSAAYKGMIKERFFLSNVRGFKSPLCASLYSDDIDVSVYDNLIKEVHEAIPVLDDYVKLKQKKLNIKEMHWYDLYLNLSTKPKTKYSIKEAKELIFKALAPLGKEYLSNLDKAFSERWIDFYPNVGKKSGAYSFGCYDSKPYVLMNFVGDLESVNTMVHELGHSMHSYYSNKNQSYANHDYPIFLAEIASTVNEMLLNEYLLKNAKTKDEKIYYLTYLLEKIRTTIYRQTMFAEFEKIVFDKYQNKEALTSDLLSNTYYELNKLYYGNSLVLDDKIRYEWERIPHFYTPFYVYKYASGLSCAITIAYSILNGDENALKNYMRFLSSGGSKFPLDILDEVGVDVRSGKPVKDALRVFKDKLDELKRLI